MKKSKYQQELEKEPYYNLKEGDLGEEAKFEINKDSFKGPFKCHGKKTALIEKKTSYGDLEFSYNVWQCKACKKEYVDMEQARVYEKFLIMKKFLMENPITIERSMNYDGKAFFFRFPKELASNLHKEDLVDIKLLSTDGSMFLVEIKHRHS
ncbi:hypothetical protein HYX08_00430 [Candidatus Woesearchaeota archaeon]|nr:hypothetical protein [Candidatus Woesearchaeota archaeon]